MVLAQEESARTNAEKQVCDFIQLLAMQLVKQKVKPKQCSVGKLHIMYVYMVSKTHLKCKYLDLNKNWNIAI